MKIFCKYCGKEMKVKLSTKIFCSALCCTKWHQHYNPKTKKYIKEYYQRPYVKEKNRKNSIKWNKKFREEHGYWYTDRWREEHAREKLERICKNLNFSPATTRAMIMDGVILDKRLKELKKHG